MLCIGTLLFGGECLPCCAYTGRYLPFTSQDNSTLLNLNTLVLVITLCLMRHT